MKIYQNLTIIGTSHISRESIEEVKTVISTQTPEVVALELDKNRLYALIKEDKTSKISIKHATKIGFKGYLFGKLGHWAEQKVGKLVGVKPGEEMITAYKTAQKYNCKIALIDQKIEVTLKNLSKELTYKEKFRFLVDILKSPFKKEKIEFNLEKVPDEKIILKLLKKVKERYPNVYKVLIEERNIFMAKRLYRLMSDYKSVVAVVGAGHVDEIIKEIKCLQKEN